MFQFPDPFTLLKGNPDGAPMMVQSGPVPSPIPAKSQDGRDPHEPGRQERWLNKLGSGKMATTYGVFVEPLKRAPGLQTF